MEGNSLGWLDEEGRSLGACSVLGSLDKDGSSLGTSLGSLDKEGNSLGA